MEKLNDVNVSSMRYDPIQVIRGVDIKTLLLTVLAISVSGLAVQFIYNVYFHPLAKFPGPVIGCAFRLPSFLIRVTGSDPFYHWAQHQKYGDIVRVGPDALSFAHPDAWRDIYAKAYGVGGRGGIGRHERMYTSWAQERSVFNANGTTHQRQRKVLAPAFSERAVREYEPCLQRHVHQLTERLRIAATEGRPANMADLYTSTTLDIMADLCARQPTKYLEEGKSHGGWKLEVEQKLYHLMMSLRTFPLLSWLFIRLVIIPIYLIAKEDQTFDANKIQQRYRSSSPGKSEGSSEGDVDLWKFAQKGEDGAIAMPSDEMLSNVELLMFAGSETTANLLTGVTYFLTQDKDKMDKLASLIRSTFQSSDDMTLTSLVKLDYLNACLREGLRMHPPTPSNMLRKIPRGGAVVCGEALPGGTEVSAAPYAMDHLAKYWHKPMAFEPERWTGAEEFQSDSKDVLQPFSVGPQNCLGMILAWHEARLILASTLFHFDLALAVEDPKWLEQRGLVVWEKNALTVRLREQTAT